ncbi:hypothetical protein [Methylobacterium iners]|uniref:WYL domain-containing protein n=1 Tax=Methylobacterium iners TaxID=418707 RepID=A0ABQ4S379_9HYPH|nr:hypothetical protein [Methylobacterium iners]GJD96919.1 hypothetical protein OCOJLMKI_4146 [Methylobacterium iners]
MRVETACQALREKRRLEIRYDGYTRVVEVHACGTTSDGNAVMRVWQVRGGSESGERTGWKLLRLDETRSLELLEETSEAPRRGYAKNDKAIAHIRCQM